MSAAETLELIAAAKRTNGRAEHIRHIPLR